MICDLAKKYLTNNSLYYLDETIKNIQDRLKAGYNTTDVDSGNDEIIIIGKIII